MALMEFSQGVNRCALIGCFGPGKDAILISAAEAANGVVRMAAAARAMDDLSPII